jgi:hypothetical protein
MLEHADMTVEEQQVYEAIGDDSDLEHVYETLEKHQGDSGFSVPRAAVRYFVTCQSGRIAAIQDLVARNRVFDFIRALQAKIGGGFYACENCGYDVPIRRSRTTEQLQRTRDKHATVCRR